MELALSRGTRPILAPSRVARLRAALSAVAAPARVTAVKASFTVALPALAIGASGCSEARPPTGPPSSQLAATETAVAFRPVTSAVNAQIVTESGVHTRVARTKTEWIALWSELTQGSFPRPKPPNFNPEKEALLVILAAPPAVQISVKLTRKPGGASAIHTQLAKLPPGCPSTAVVRYPVTVIAVDPKDLPTGQPKVEWRTSACG
jgi:hypothetical protein